MQTNSKVMNGVPVYPLQVHSDFARKWTYQTRRVPVHPITVSIEEGTGQGSGRVEPVTVRV